MTGNVVAFVHIDTIPNPNDRAAPRPSAPSDGILMVPASGVGPPRAHREGDGGCEEDEPDEDVESGVEVGKPRKVERLADHRDRAHEPEQHQAGSGGVPGSVAAASRASDDDGLTSSPS